MRIIGIRHTAKLSPLVSMKSCLVIEVGSIWCSRNGRMKACRKHVICQWISAGHGFIWLTTKCILKRQSKRRLTVTCFPKNMHSFNSLMTGWIWSNFICIKKVEYFTFFKLSTNAKELTQHQRLKDFNFNRNQLKHMLMI